MASLYPVVRLIIDPKIEELLPIYSEKPVLKNCFVCETPKTEKSTEKARVTKGAGRTSKTVGGQLGQQFHFE